MSLNQKTTFTIVPSKVLNDSTCIPVVGLGLGAWQTTDDSETIEQAVEIALSAGYCHFDTTQQNGEVIGRVLNKWLTEGKVKREELYVVSKLPLTAMWPYRVNEYLRESLKSLQLEYVDLYLIQFPVGIQGQIDSNDELPRDDEGKVILDKTHLEPIWKAMENEIKVGRTKSIGVCDFNQEQIQRILNSCSIQPAVLQTEVNAYFQQKSLREFCSSKNIAVVAYAPLGISDITDPLQETLEKPIITKDPVVRSLGRKYGRTPGQILLRFLVQSNVIVIPKCLNPFDIRTSIKVCEFTLEEQDMKTLEQLDNPDEYNLSRALFCEIFTGVENHPEYPWKN